MPQRKRILVADDQGANRKLTMHRLEQLGFDVDVVENGLQVIAAISRAPYDLVFMDCHMPHMDGFRTAQWIRQQEGTQRHTPIIAFTASLGTTDRQRCLSAGMDDFLSKPAAETELLRVLAQWLPDAEISGGSIEIDRAALVAIFLGDAPRHIEALRDALANRDAGAVAESAHALKSGSGNVGATRVYELCDALEGIGGRGDLAGAAAIFNQLETELSRVRSGKST
ncbi:MAG: response regulator [Acidobacteriota bacterium]|nr:response regulator [Acidobacteriota bacterium]